MGLLVPIALFGFPLLAVILFATLPIRRAILISYIGGWLFLPSTGYGFSGWPDYGKYAALALGVVLGVALFDHRGLTRFRGNWIDVLMLLFCVWPGVSHLYHGHSLNTALNWVLVHLLMWGVPYLIGRAYFADRAGMRELAIAVAVGGLVYAPLCWIEIRMSPQLNQYLYGFFPHSFKQHVRYGGYRPIVFMQHGLMVALWMAATSVIALALWQSKTVTRIWRVPMLWVVPFMFLTTIFCKSANGIAALGLGSIAFTVAFLGRRIALVVTVAALIAPVYIVVRTTGIWTGDSLVSLINDFDQERAGSLRIRLYQEDVYTDRALQQPIFGWVDGRMIPTDQWGNRLTRGNDAFWIIAFGLYGLISLASVFTVLTAAPIAGVRRCAGESLVDSGPRIGLALAVVLFAVDCLVNGMINPVFTIAAGACVGAGQIASGQAGAQAAASAQKIASSSSILLVHAGRA